MADNDKWTASTTTNDIEIVEHFGVFSQGSEVFSEFSVFIASRCNSTHIVSTLLGYDHV